jgi:GT2 family glycosyltransferase
MSLPPALTFVVPTCGRPASIERLLRALAQQQTSAPFAVVIVSDGVPASRVGVPPSEAWPFAIRVETQARKGPAAARNLGASIAQSDLLVFMDDDIEPGPSVVEAHLRFHARRPGAIGAGSLDPVASHEGFLGSALAGWWEVMGDGLADPRHRFTFRDLLTGHCSMSRTTFAEVGGFDPALACHEDFDFGYRALAQNVPLAFVDGAAARHHDASDLPKILRRKVDEGIADVQLARKHPALAAALPLGRPLADVRLARAVQRAALRRHGVNDRLARGLPSLMSVFERTSMRDKWRETLERAMDYWYWRGVSEALGPIQAVDAFRAGVERPLAEALDVDLAAGLDEVESTIDGVRPLALRVTLGGYLVGELPEVPGAERLRGVHLRPLIRKHLADGYVQAAASAGALPPPLQLIAARLRHRGEQPATARAAAA